VQEAKNAFKELLESVHVEADWTWEQVRLLLAYTARLHALFLVLCLLLVNEEIVGFVHLPSVGRILERFAFVRDEEDLVDVNMKGFCTGYASHHQ